VTIPHPRERRGIGVLLVLVVTLALVLFVAGVAQLMSSGQVYRQTARGSGGLTAEYLARSAVAELFWQVQRAANDPLQPAFRRLREILLTGERSTSPDGLIDISKDFDCSNLLDQLDHSEHKAFYRNFRIDHLSVRAGVDRTRPLYTNLTLKLSATASLTLGASTVLRRVEETRQIGILLAAPKRPLDQAAFLVLDDPFIGDFRTAARAVVQMAALYRQIAQWLVAWQATLARKGPGQELSFDIALPGSVPGQPARNVRVMLTGEDYAFDGLWPPLAGDPATIQVPADGAMLAAFGTSPVDLASYDHEMKLGDALERTLPSLGDLSLRIDRQLETFAATSGRPFTAGEHAAWAAQMGQVGQDVHAALEVLIREVARVSTEMAPHLKVLPGMASFSLEAQGRLGPPLYPIAYHITSQDEFDRLLARHPRLNAHVAYQGDQPLKINRMGVAGRLVISSKGAPLEVGNLVASTKDQDWIVLAGSDITFTGGTVCAGVVVRGRAHFTGETTFEGNLVLESLPRRRDRRGDQELAGRVLYDPRLYSGVAKSPLDLTRVKLSSYAVGFSTVPEDVEISWK